MVWVCITDAAQSSSIPPPERWARPTVLTWPLCVSALDVRFSEQVDWQAAAHVSDCAMAHRYLCDPVLIRNLGEI
jgi:hypothetical protein